VSVALKKGVAVRGSSRAVAQAAAEERGTPGRLTQIDRRLADLSISGRRRPRAADLDDQQLLQDADAALYQAKAEGRNRLAFADRGASHLLSEV
jgi:GGDEF domain-containing protein